MCRMVAVIGNNTFSPQPFITALGHVAQHALHAPHQDGHGIVYIAANNYSVHKEPLPIWETTFASSQLMTDAFCAHARKSSFGTVSIDNVHPFIECVSQDCFAFMHNGTVYDIHTLFPHIEVESGTCDSRVYAKAIAHTMLSGASFETSLLECATTIRTKSTRYTSANALLLYHNNLYCVRSCTLEEDYYTLYYTYTDDTVIVATDRFGAYTWNLIPNNTIMKCVHNHEEKNIYTLATL